ncbi:MAG TPA: hypothetical protein VFH90_06400 [Candidatus Limnocylindria bacterium]|nr:hypothetical protein [Candidatus Limnocylindria bacterium]
MNEGPIPVSCERCGRRVELQPPAPGDRDLGLDRIKAAFRYCSGCQLFIGRTCCWQPEAIACTVDAPRFAVSVDRLPAQGPNHSARDATARSALEGMAASLEELERIEVPVGDPRGSDTDRGLAKRAWVDAWGEIASLVARIETSRDAAAKSLWRPLISPEGPRAEGLDSELQGLEDRYRRTRVAAEARLRAAAEPLARSRRRRTHAPRWRAGSSLVLGALASVAVLSFSTASLLQLGIIDPFADGRSASATQPEEAVLGGAPSGLIAALDIDTLRLGRLDESESIASVAGDIQVVEAPSPFDRGIRFGGDGSHTFCAHSTASDDGTIRFDADLLTQSALVAARLKLTVAPAEAAATIVSVPLRPLGNLQSGAWHRLHAAWEPRQPAAVTFSGTSGQVRRLTVPLARDDRAVPGTVCIAVSGMGTHAQLLIANLRVRR